ncbi:winged helix-turn-helix domain-containing protein [Streptomyces sp. 1222.5]|uniref:winged helix-turn-helix domain-containing protein n=1 Tax=Streptomyces sp. 1222.5 TaxID=1881026 RepID=UPI003EB8A190
MPDRFAYERAIRRSTLPPPSRHLALTFATWADVETGVIPDRFQPSMRTLLEATGMSKGSMLAHLKRLEAEGWIKCEHADAHEARTKHVRNAYSLAIPIGLGQEMTQPAGARSADDPALGHEPTQSTVTSRPSPRSAADPKSSYKSPSPSSPRARAEQLLRDLGATGEETTKILSKIEAGGNVRNLAAYMKQMEAQGDLARLIAEERKAVNGREAAARQSIAMAGGHHAFEDDGCGTGTCRCERPRRHRVHGGS